MEHGPPIEKLSCGTSSLIHVGKFTKWNAVYRLVVAEANHKAKVRVKVKDKVRVKAKDKVKDKLKA